MDIEQNFNHFTQEQKNHRLLEAARKGEIAIAEQLIQNGAEINSKNNFGYTVLIIAADNGHDFIIELLIRHGSEINARDNFGRTALMFAAKNGQMTSLELLIQGGAKINIESNSGSTALILAARHGYTTTAFRILCEMTSEQIQDFSTTPERVNLVNQFKQSLKDNANRIYDILMPSIEAFPGSHFESMPSEIINHILALQALSIDDFPDWYKHRVETDLALALKFKNTAKTVPALIFSQLELDNNKRKADNQLDREECSKKSKTTP